MNNKGSLIPLAVRENIFQATMILWGVIAVIVSIILFFSQVTVEGQNTKIIVMGMSFPMANNGVIWITYIFWIISMLCIITFPKYLLDIIDKKRISLVLSKPISRNDFILQNILSLTLCVFIYSIASALLVVLVGIIKFHLFPTGIVLSLLFLPLAICILIIMTMYFTFKFNSYSLSAVIVLAHLIILSPALASRAVILKNAGIEKGILKIIADIFYYVTPHIYKGINYCLSLVSGHYPDLIELAGLVFSLLPVSYLLYRHVNRKEF